MRAERRATIGPPQLATPHFRHTGFASSVRQRGENCGTANAAEHCARPLLHTKCPDWPGLTAVKENMQSVRTAFTCALATLPVSQRLPDDGAPAVVDPGFAMYPVAVYASVVQALPLVPHQKLAFFIGTLADFFQQQYGRADCNLRGTA